MNKHVTSLKLSKKLKAAGIEQDSEFWWRVKFSTGRTRLVQCPVVGLNNDDYDFYSAFLADECLEALPLKVDKKVFGMEKNKDYWAISYGWKANRTTRHKSLVEASGQMWLWVIENGYYE